MGHMKGIVLFLVLCAIQGYSQEIGQLSKLREAVIQPGEDQFVSITIEFAIQSYDGIEEIVVEEVWKDGTTHFAEGLPLHKMADGKVILRAQILTGGHANHTYRIPTARLSALDALSIHAKGMGEQKSNSLRYQLNP
jgi:hypothetical protein